MANGPDLIFDAPLSSTFKPTKSVMLVGDKLTLDFELVVLAPGLAQVEWYLEFTSNNPFNNAAKWAREVAEEDMPGGIVNMPFVVRTFYVNGSPLVLLPTGTSRISAQFERSHNFGRAQIRLAGGGKTTAKIYSVFGMPHVPPPAAP